jgi:hypothetical protein
VINESLREKEGEEKAKEEKNVGEVTFRATYLPISYHMRVCLSRISRFFDKTDDISINDASSSPTDGTLGVCIAGAHTRCFWLAT